MLHPIRKFRGSSRRAKIITGITSGLLIPALAFAATIFLFHAGVTGSVKSGKFAYTLSLPANPVSGTGASDICGGVTLGSGNTSLVIAPGTGGLPGDVCGVSFMVTGDAANTTTGTVNGITFPAGSLPSGWTATLAPCGPGANVPNGSASPLETLTFTIANTAPLNGATTTLTGDSVDIGPSSGVTSTSGTCTITAP